MSSVRAIRGATQSAANTAAAIGDATKELLTEMLRANQISAEEVISVIFTVSPDLNARVMAHVETELKKSEISHIYLGAAKSLRRDIAQ